MVAEFRAQKEVYPRGRDMQIPGAPDPGVPQLPRRTEIVEQGVSEKTS